MAFGRRILILALLIAGALPSFSQPVPPRTNVAAYDDEDGIAKRAYRESPYLLELGGTWKQRQTDTSILYSRQIDVEKVWRQFRVYLNLRCGRAVRVSVNDKEVGRSDDSRAWNEFLLDTYLRYGKSNTLTIEALKQPREAELERGDLQAGLNGDPYILFKNDPGIDDYTLTADYDNASRSGTLSLDVRIFNGKKKGKYYLEAEIWNPQGRTFDRMGRWIVFDKKAEATIDLSRTWSNVQPWTAETPTLYTLVLRLRNENMEEEEVVGTRFGFRTLLVKDGQLLLNGTPLTLKGVAYGIEHTEGYAGRERIRQDLLSMKRNNINAVRTAKYSPMEPWFYEQCDEMGLYVVCDANLMPVSSQHHAVATDKDYIPLFERRVENMYGIYKNYTSIIMWSLGDSRDNGVCMQAAYRRLKALESQRPVVFSGADYADNTDLVVFSNPTAQDLRQAVGKSISRPMLMLTSVDADNFSMMEHLWATVETSRQLQGGFVGQWPLPAVRQAELKHLYSPFDVRLTKHTQDEVEFAVYNRNDYADFSQYVLEYTLYTNMQSNITAGDLPVGIDGGGADRVKIALPPLDLQQGEELFIRFDLTQRGQRQQGKAAVYGSVVYPLQAARWKPVDSASIPYFADTLVPAPLRHQLLFLGHEGWVVDTVGQLIRRPDRRTLSVDRMLRYKASDGTTMCDVRTTYTAFGSGDVVVEYTVAPSERLRDKALLPAFKVWHIFDSVSWFGLDREVVFQERHSGLVGIYNAPAVGLARRQVRWCAAHTGDEGLFAQMEQRQCEMRAEASTLTLLPGESSAFRIHLRPYKGVRPEVFSGWVYPRSDSGILPTPVISAARGRFSSPLEVTLTGAAGCDLRYTLDGTDPAPESPRYTRPLTLTTTTVLKARAFAKGMPPSFTATRKFSYDYIVGTSFSRKPNTPYNVGADSLLFDGEEGTVDDLTRGWLGFSAKDVATTLRLSKPIDVEYVTLRFAHAPQLWAFAPRTVTLAFSSDGVSYGDAVQVPVPIDPSDEGASTPQVVELRVAVDRSGVKAVRVEAAAIDGIPAWHRAKGLKPWLLMDEITVVEK